MRIVTDTQKRPVQCKVRRYPPAQRKFLNQYVSKLVDLGFFKPNPNARWQAAPLLVPKHGSKAAFRVTIDLRPVNAATIPHAWPMPNIDAEINDFAGSTCFASLDFCSGYWQLPVHPDSYDACGVVCPSGTYSSTRVLQGLRNAVSYFQSTVEPIFSELRSNMKAWLDDFNFYHNNEDGLLNCLRRSFQLCREYNLFLSAKKSTFYAKEIKWCGRIINKSGFKMDPRRVEALKDMSLPETAGELCQFLYCCRWMSNTIPDFSRRAAALTKVLEEAYTKAGKRTKRSIKNILLKSLSWDTEQVNSYKDIQEGLRNSVCLAYPKKDHVICIHTDASEKYWAAVVSQTKAKDLSKQHPEQQHEPLAFLGGELSGSERNWTTYEKEGFAIFRVFEKLDYMLLGEQPVHVFTDHRNLLFVFAPKALDPMVGKHVISKVQRWAVFLSRFDFMIEHIDGCQNIFADMLTRWTKSYRSPKVGTKKVCALHLQNQQVVPSTDEIIWPDTVFILNSQSKEECKLGDHIVGEDGLIRVNNRIWIPAKDIDLQLKIIVISHCGSQGHRGQDATISTIKEDFIWENMEVDIASFVRECLHCVVSRTGDIIPRPLATALHGTKPNEVIHADFLYMGRSERDNLKYLLILKDDLSSFVWLWPTSETTGESAAEAISAWVATFGSFKWLVTDQGSHFCNMLTTRLTEKLKVKHHFTTAYSPWANGTVERACREVLRACRALLHELLLAPQEWASVTDCMQSVINHSPLKRLGLRDKTIPGVFRTPLEVFTGHKPIRPLLRALPYATYESCPSISEAQVKQLMNVDKIQESLEILHKDVSEKVSATRRKAIDKHNSNTNVQPVNFQKGDFVLVRNQAKGAHKLSFKWIGPMRIVDVKQDLVFIVENLISGKKDVVHARRLQLYRNDIDGKDIDESLLKYAEHSTTSYQTIEKLLDIRKHSKGVEVLVEWEGCPDSIDNTWEPVEQLFNDIPGLLEDFLHTNGKRALKKNVLSTFYQRH